MVLQNGGNNVAHADLKDKNKLEPKVLCRLLNLVTVCEEV